MQETAPGPGLSEAQRSELLVGGEWLPGVHYPHYLLPLFLSSGSCHGSMAHGVLHPQVALSDLSQIWAPTQKCFNLSSVMPQINDDYDFKEAPVGSRAGRRGLEGQIFTQEGSISHLNVSCCS